MDGAFVSSDSREGTAKETEAPGADAQLDKGKPAAVGVSHMDANDGVDAITDHFVTITGWATVDGNTGDPFWDPSTSIEANAKGTFYAAGESQRVREGKDASGYVHQRRFDVSMLRTNEEDRGSPSRGAATGRRRRRGGRAGGAVRIQRAPRSPRGIGRPRW